MERIPVIPSPDLFELHAILAAELFDLRFRKSHIFRKSPGRKHSIFPEIRHSRLSAIFLDRQNACHVSGFYHPICLSAVLEQPPQKPDIRLLQKFVCPVFAEQGVPFIDDEYELMACGLGDIIEHVGQGILSGHIRIGGAQLINDLSFQIDDHIRHLPLHKGI